MKSDGFRLIAFLFELETAFSAARFQPVVAHGFSFQLKGGKLKAYLVGHHGLKARGSLYIIV